MGPVIIYVGGAGGGGGGGGELGGPSIFVDGIWVWGGLTCQQMTLGGRGGLQVSFKY